MERIPVAHHPGGLIGREIKARGRSQSEFAQLLQKTDTEVSQLITGKRNITLDRAIRIATVFGTSEEFWMKMQQAYDRYQRYKLEKNQKLQAEIKSRVEAFAMA